MPGQAGEPPRWVSSGRYIVQPHRSLVLLRLSRLPSVGAGPLAFELVDNLVVWRRATRRGVRQPALYSLNDIQLIRNVIEGAVVGESVEKRPYGLLGAQLLLLGNAVGGPEGNRTPDLFHAKEARSRCATGPG